MSSAAAGVPHPVPQPLLLNPFHGLRRFEIDDSALFFGRDRETYDVLRRLRLMHFVAVLGPSGCGKSSLIRAGVLAALRAGYMAEDAPWRIVSLQPGNGPLEAWRAALGPLLRPGADEDELLVNPARALDAASGKIAILVDQFEELFQYSERTGRDRDVRLFLQAMLSAGAATDSRLYIVITMRTEYLAQCAAYGNLSDAINEGLYLVPEMTRDQMREAIVEPVRKVGAEITAPLVDRLLNDASGQNDALPVLQHALMQMWSKRRPWEPLGLPEYEEQIRALAGSGPTLAVGGMAAFISGHAHDVLSSLDPDDQAAAKKIFQTLTELTADGRAVRRATPLPDLQKSTGIPADRVERVVGAFRTEGFLNVWDSPRSGAGLVDLTHEAVARQWGELREWMLEESRARRNVRRVNDAAREWTDHKTNRAFLFRGLQLAESQTYLQGRDYLLDATATEFLKASRRNEVWNRLLSPPVVAGVLIVLVMLGGLTWLSVSKANLASSRAEQAAKQTDLARDLLKRAQDEAERAKKAQQEATQNAQSVTALTARLAQPTTSPSEATMPRVYIQIRDDVQRAQAQSLSSQLKTRGFVVPGIEKVAVGPASTEVRYFGKVDEAGAKQILDVLTQQKVAAKPVLVEGHEATERPQEAHFELWLAPSAVEKAPALAARAPTAAETDAPARASGAASAAAAPTAAAASTACKSTSTTLSVETGGLQKLELQLGRACMADGRLAWTTRFRTFSRESAGAAYGEADGDVELESTKAMDDYGEYEANLLETARAGLDAGQAKQAAVAAITLRALNSGAATQAQVAKDVRDIILSRSATAGAPEKR